MTQSNIAPAQEISHTDASDAGETSRRGFDLQLILALVVSFAVIAPRSVDMALRHSESWDDEYHSTRGLLFLTGNLAKVLATQDLWINDPPLGQGIASLPLLAVNWYYGRDLVDTNPYSQPLGRDVLATINAVWKSLLFMPLVAVAFLWCRSLYGVRAAWLASMLLTFEPSFAAHIPVPVLDVLGVTAIGVAAYLGWRFVERPTVGRAMGVGIATATALMTKHTAIGLPVLYAAYGLTTWLVRPLMGRVAWGVIRDDLVRKLRLSLLASIVGLISLWVLTGFEVSPISPKPVRPGSSPLHTQMRKILHRSWPAGLYGLAFGSARLHNQLGHPNNYLFGEHKTHGWWYYFPVLLTYKLPLGVTALLLLAMFTVWSTGPRWGDLGLLIPWVGWTGLLMAGTINVGIRHYLPAYFFVLLFCSRALVNSGVGRSAMAWIAFAAVAIHSLTYHPDYIAYLNFSREKPYLAIGDSNLDWGQSLKQVAQWLERNPQPGRPVTLAYFGVNQGGIASNLGDRVQLLGSAKPMPSKGILIVSAALLAIDHRFEAIRFSEPIAVVGHGAVLIFDLEPK